MTTGSISPTARGPYGEERRGARSPAWDVSWTPLRDKGRRGAIRSWNLSWIWSSQSCRAETGLLSRGLAVLTAREPHLEGAGGSAEGACQLPPSGSALGIELESGPPTVHLP